MESKHSIVALTPEKLVDPLARFGFPGSVDLLQQDIDNGAPCNDDGTINLIHYMAWMIKGVTINDKGSLTLYGRVPGVHQLLAQHLTAEYRVKTQGRGRTVDEWKLKPERNDNHWLDCIVGCAVCGSMLGATLPEFMPAKVKARSKIKLSDRIGSQPQASLNAPRGRIKLSEIRKQKA